MFLTFARNWQRELAVAKSQGKEFEFNCGIRCLSTIKTEWLPYTYIPLALRADYLAAILHSYTRQLNRVVSPDVTALIGSLIADLTIGRMIKDTNALDELEIPQFNLFFDRMDNASWNETGYELAKDFSIRFPVTSFVLVILAAKRLIQWGDQ